MLGVCLVFDIYYSFHIASAEYDRIDVLLTTDDRLLRKDIKYSKLLQVKLAELNILTN